MSGIVACGRKVPGSNPQWIKGLFSLFCVGFPFPPTLQIHECVSFLWWANGLYVLLRWSLRHHWGTKWVRWWWIIEHCLYPNTYGYLWVFYYLLSVVSSHLLIGFILAAGTLISAFSFTGGGQPFLGHGWVWFPEQRDALSVQVRWSTGLHVRMPRRYNMETKSSHFLHVSA